MSAPATNGVERTSLSQLKIGDYIKGVFSTDGTNGFSITIGGGSESELTAVKFYNVAATGYFYFLKVDQGLLIADRDVVAIKNHAWLNQLGFYKGSQYRALTYAEALKYIKSSDLNGNIKARSTSVWKYTSHFSGIPSYGVLEEFPIYYNPANQHNYHWCTGFDSYIATDIATNSNDDSFNITTSKSGNFLYIPAYEYVDNSKSTNIYY